MLEALAKQYETLQKTLSLLTLDIVNRKKGDEARASKEDSIKLRDLPEFDGPQNLDDYWEWEQKIEGHFKHKGVDDH